MDAKEVIVYTLSDGGDQDDALLRSRARELLPDACLDVRSVDSLSTWEQKQIQIRAYGRPTYPVFVLGSVYINGWKELEAFVREGRQGMTTEESKASVVRRLEVRDEGTEGASLPDEQLRADLQKIARETEDTDMAWGEVKVGSADGKKFVEEWLVEGECDEPTDTLKRSDVSADEKDGQVVVVMMDDSHASESPRCLGADATESRLLYVDIFRKLKECTYYINEQILNDRFNVFDKTASQLELATKGMSDYLSDAFSDTASSEDAPSVANSSVTDSELTFTFPVVQCNWYWRHQKRYLKLDTEQLARLHPENFKVRHVIPYMHIHSILIKNHGEFLIKYTDRDRVEREIAYITSGRVFAGKVGEAIQQVASIKNHRITVTYVSL
ncbi:uncharacterized protein LOC126320763 [Schistocerca gregaria]|uniref:uncharacterized protein LOC126320763 n=1 Tax=Schistocerca gregaria TaxID=7010 RepID=UPI00211EB6CE|nr:uncharacterized protein LOC126320763 [Schistocerca gregaria]